jgi:hypothetical protein
VKEHMIEVVREADGGVTLAESQTGSGDITLNFGADNVKGLILSGMCCR